MTIGMLFIAIATGVGMANTIIDNIGDVHQWYRSAIVEDFFVRALMPDMATGQAADTDTIVASVKAYVNALNRLIVRREKLGSDRKEVSYKDAG